MEKQENVGTVPMQPFDSLKKICQENLMNRVITELLPRYQRISNNRRKRKEQIPMFTKDTRDEYLGEDIMEELRKDENER